MKIAQYRARWPDLELPFKLAESKCVSGLVSLFTFLSHLRLYAKS